eukprot:1472539-Prymnesium_polylepis.1
MTGPELASAVRAKLPLIVVVLSDGELGMMSGLQRAAGAGTYKTILNGYDATQLAQSVGAAHRRVGSERELQAAIEWAAAHVLSSGPVLLDVATSYAYPSFYARGIAGATPPASDKLPLAPPPVRMAQPDAKPCTEATDLWNFIVRAGATAHPERIAVLNRDGSAGGSAYPAAPTYGQLLGRCASLAAALAELGTKVGDVVGVLAPNRAEVMEAHLAVGGSLRGVVLNLNYRLSVDELAFVIADAGCKWVVTDSAFKPALDSVLGAGGGAGLAGVVCLDDVTHSGAVREHGYEALVKRGASLLGLDLAAPDGTKATPPASKVADGRTAGMACEMYYTSGTSGRPKGVQLSHANVCVHAAQCVGEHRHHPNDVWGHFAPMFHL